MMLLGELNIYSLLYASRWRLPEAQSSIGLAIPLYSGILQFSPQILPISLIPMHMQCRSLLASTADEYSRLLCYFFFPFPGYCDHMMESRSQRIPRMILRGVRLRGVVRRSQAGGLAFSIVATFVLAFLRETCLTYVCTQILLLPLTLVSSSICIRVFVAPGL